MLSLLSGCGSSQSGPPNLHQRSALLSFTNPLESVFSVLWCVCMCICDSVLRQGLTMFPWPGTNNTQLPLPASAGLRADPTRGFMGPGQASCPLEVLQGPLLTLKLLFFLSSDCFSQSAIDTLAVPEAQACVPIMSSQHLTSFFNSFFFPSCFFLPSAVPYQPWRDSIFCLFLPEDLGMSLMCIRE